MKLNDFLKAHLTKDKAVVTNTRIPDKEGGGNGAGSYQIKDAELDSFYQIYFRSVFDPTKPSLEYLTEMQREVGPLAIDIDFRYRAPSRAYTAQHLEDFVDAVTEELIDMYQDLGTVQVFVLEKSKVNQTDQHIKDGIHFIFGVNMHRCAKEMLRRRILARIGDVWKSLESALTNDWPSVLDHNVMIGGTAWQLIGSRKPRHEAYRHTFTYHADCADKTVSLSRDTAGAMTLELLPMLSVRFLGHPTPDLAEHLEPEFHELQTGQTKKKSAFVATTAGPRGLNTAEDVDAALEALFSTTQDYKLRETHDYVMLLPVKYYGANSFEKWVRVGWALKNTDVNLFPSWVKFSAQSSTFLYQDVPEMFDQWSKWSKNDASNMLTKRSIMYWARTENPAAYVEVNEQTLSRCVEVVTNLPVVQEYDIAGLLYHMYKDPFVCVSIKNRIWFEYQNHRWSETDMGTNLRNKISGVDGLYPLFARVMAETTSELHTLDQVANPDAWDRAKKRIAKVTTILQDLKKTEKKGNIMKEASFMFYIRQFMDKLDTHSHILCCSNGVIDFNEGALFRPGVAEDYTSKCTNIPFEPLTEEHSETVAEINEFFEQLFPVEELRHYMWEHLASTLIGKNTNQTFNIYIGKGRNGKSVLVELMGKVLGEYKATVPVSMITQKRPGIGGSSSEVAQLVGIRYAVMQEPSHGERINEGVMKELTGGDPIQARSLYQNSMTFRPQMKLVVLTNIELCIDTTDDGTWRRIRMCDFESIFCEEPVEGDPYKPYQFQVDKRIDQKFDRWKTVLLAMLVARANKTQGLVSDCAMVMSKSNKYRKEQDFFSDFIRFKIQDAPKGTVKKSDMMEAFAAWWKGEHGTEKCPTSKDLSRYMNRRYGDMVEAMAGKSAYWKGIILVKEVFEEPDGI